MRLLRKTSTILCAVVLLCGAITARAGEPTFAWKVTKDGKTAYLLGSIHMATDAMYPLAPEVEAAFAESKALAVEADIEKVDQVQLQMSVMQKGLYQGGDTLSKKLPKETLDALNVHLKKDGQSAAALDMMKPWLVGLTISMLEFKKLGFKEELGIDKHFLDLARDKKKILELESAQFQIDLLSGFTDDQQEKFLKYSLAEVGRMKEQVAEMVATWTKGDADAFHKVSTKGNEKFPGIEDVMKKLIDDRNVKMAEKVEGYLKTGDTTFVVAGALHMSGEKGIVNLLKAKGYTVEQIQRK